MMGHNLIRYHYKSFVSFSWCDMFFLSFFSGSGTSDKSRNERICIKGKFYSTTMMDWFWNLVIYYFSILLPFSMSPSQRIVANFFIISTYFVNFLHSIPHCVCYSVFILFFIRWKSYFYKPLFSVYLNFYSSKASSLRWFWINISLYYLRCSLLICWLNLLS